MNADQKEDLIDIMNSDGWKSILLLVDSLIERQGESLLKTDASNEKALVITKAEYDGARKIRVALDKVRKDYLKGKE